MLLTLRENFKILFKFYNFFLYLTGANTDNLPPGVLYKVKATYKYTQEDVDELSFEVGEIIRVVEYDDPEEQVCFPLFFVYVLKANPFQVSKVQAF